MKILIIDAFPANFIEQLEKMPVEITFIPKADQAEVLEKIPEAEILIMNSKIRVTKEVKDIAPNLKMLIRAGVGMDHIDVEYLESQGVIVLNTKGGNAEIFWRNINNGVVAVWEMNVLKMPEAATPGFELYELTSFYFWQTKDAGNTITYLENGAYFFEFFLYF